MEKPTSSCRLLVVVGAIGMSACSVGSGEMARPDAGSADELGDIETVDASTICFEAGVQAEPSKLPVDIIWVVDTSGSMSFESATVEENLNAFAAQVDSWGIDYRVIMVAARGDGTSVCVPEPLAGPSCEDSERFRHIPLTVGSTNALGKLVEAYPAYQDFLRVDSSKQFVVVSDDEASGSINDSWFRTAVADLLDPGFPARESAPHGFVFHSIVAYGDMPLRGCDTGAEIGQSYLNLTQLTGGVKAKVCETDWQPIFAALQTAVIEGSRLPCTFDIPDPPEGKDPDPNQLNVLYARAQDTPITIPRVDSPADCGQAYGWHYDDPSNPTKIVMCEATCDVFEADTEASEIQMQFGCETVVR